MVILLKYSCRKAKIGLEEEMKRKVFWHRTVAIICILTFSLANPMTSAESENARERALPSTLDGRWTGVEQEADGTTARIMYLFDTNHGFLRGVASYHNPERNALGIGAISNIIRVGQDQVRFLITYEEGPSTWANIYYRLNLQGNELHGVGANSKGTSPVRVGLKRVETVSMIDGMMIGFCSAYGLEYDFNTFECFARDNT